VARFDVNQDNSADGTLGEILLCEQRRGDDQSGQAAAMNSETFLMRLLSFSHFSIRLSG